MGAQTMEIENNGEGRWAQPFVDICMNAALGKESWVSVLQVLCSLLGAQKAIVAIVKDQSYNVTTRYNNPSLNLKPCDRGGFKIDRMLTPAAFSASSQIVTGFLMANESSELEHRKFKALLANADLSDSLQAYILDDNVIGRHMVILYRGFERPAFENQSVEKLRVLLPHLRSAMLYAYTSTLSAENSALTESCFTALIDRKLNLVPLTSDKLDYGQATDFISHRGLKIITQSDKMSKLFKTMVKEALDGSVQFFTINDEANTSKTKKYVEFKLAPIPRTISWLSVSDELALYKVSKLTKLDIASVDIFSETFGFTPAETRTLLALSKTKSMRRASDETGVSYKTFRWHLKNIYSKTGYRSQYELLNALSEMNFTNASV